MTYFCNKIPLDNNIFITFLTGLLHFNYKSWLLFA